MKTLKYDDVKVGESYYFVDVDKSYPRAKVYIKKNKVHQKITGDFSTKNDGDRYEVVQHFAYSTEGDAKERVVEELQRWKENIIKDIDELIEEYK